MFLAPDFIPLVCMEPLCGSMFSVNCFKVAADLLISQQCITRLDALMSNAFFSLHKNEEGKSTNLAV